MVRDVLYAYSIDEKIRAYTYAVVFYFSVRMHRRNAVRAVGGGLLTSIHEYRISCNRSPRLALEGCRRSGHVLEVIRRVAGGRSAHHALLLRFEISPIQSFCFDNLP